MNPRVEAVTPQPDYTLLLMFQNGERKRYDCKSLLDFGVFRELRQIAYFLQAKAEHGTVVWPHEQDICPDTLYLDSEPIEPCEFTEPCQKGVIERPRRNLGDRAAESCVRSLR